MWSMHHVGNCEWQQQCFGLSCTTLCASGAWSQAVSGVAAACGGGPLVRCRVSDSYLGSRPVDRRRFVMRSGGSGILCVCSDSGHISATEKLTGHIAVHVGCLSPAPRTLLTARCMCRSTSRRYAAGVGAPSQQQCSQATIDPDCAAHDLRSEVLFAHFCIAGPDTLAVARQ